PIAASLRLAGYETTCAGNGEDAIESLARNSIDLLLLDVAMPVLDGLSFLQAMRMDPATAKLPVILLTASSDARFMQEAQRLGVKDYLLKSQISLKALLERIASYVGPANPQRASAPVAQSGSAAAALPKPSPAAPAAPRPKADGEPHQLLDRDQ